MNVAQVTAVAFAVMLTISSRQACAQSTPNYVGVGCYKDRFKARSMTLLANYRDPAQNTVDWNDLETSVVKKCAQEAKESNSAFFGIQFYGECWGGPGQYDRHGKSKKCVWMSGAYVGKRLANYVYMLAGEECTDYTMLTNFTRSATYDRFLFRCDSWFHGWDSGWYRFDGDAGKAMADSCMPYGRCGTNQTGWFRGRLPRVEDGINPGSVCFNDGNDCCNSRLNISVRNCGGFYVYMLPSSTNGCYKAYCGDGL